jgi:peptidoglycan/xylan/chitin deacetylase (PgdA/CDA1 family)
MRVLGRLVFADPSVSQRAPYPELTLIGLKMYIISLSFDDGFEQSNRKIADIYERFGPSACFNVLALEEVDGEKVFDIYHNFPKGNFDLWNALQARGHEIMPHGLIHHIWQTCPWQTRRNPSRVAWRFSRKS